jgi:hypothetical protein
MLREEALRPGLAACNAVSETLCASAMRYMLSPDFTTWVVAPKKLEVSNSVRPMRSVGVFMPSILVKLIPMTSKNLTFVDIF